MSLSAELDLSHGEEAIRRGWLRPEDARDCLTEARAMGLSLLSVAIRRRLLSADQARVIEGYSSSPRPVSHSLANSDKAAPARLPKVGERLGGYLIEAQLGLGGMGAVYAARRAADPRGGLVALKVLLGLEGRMMARFEREAQAAAAVDRHPHIVSVHALEREGERPFLVMDLVDGEGLDVALKSGPFTLDRALEVTACVAEALAFIHERGIVHRDLKPSNILIRAEDGAPFLTDFGLARQEGAERLTATNEQLGTPRYMSPEQTLGGASVGPPSDIFSLGVILYELVCGQRPFQAGSLTELLAQIAAAHPPPPRSLRRDLSWDAEQVILKALEKEPTRRYACAGEMAIDLRRLLRGLPASSIGPRAAWHRRVRRLGPARLLLAASALALLGAGAWFAVDQVLSRQRTRVAEAELRLRLVGLRDAEEELRRVLPAKLLDALAPGLPLQRSDAARDRDQVIARRAALAQQAAEEALRVLSADRQAAARASEAWRRASDALALSRALDGEWRALEASQPRLAEALKASRAGHGIAQDLGAELGAEQQDVWSALLLVQELRAGQLERAEARILDLAERGALGAVSTGLAFDLATAALADAVAAPEASEASIIHVLTRAQEAPAPDLSRDARWRRCREAVAEGYARATEADAQLWEALRKVEARVPMFRAPPPRPEHAEVAAALARSRGEELLAFQIIYRARQGDPGFELPAGYRCVDLMRFSNGIAAGGFDFDASLSLAVEAARAGVYFCFIDLDFVDIMVERGVFDRALELSPGDPYVRFFRGQRPLPEMSLRHADPRAYREAVERIIADAEAILVVEGLADVYRSSAVQRSAGALMRLCELEPEARRQEIRADALELVAGVAELHNPEPDQVYGFLGDRCVELGRIPEALDHYERYMILIKERAERAESGRLDEGLPPGVCWVPILNDNYRSFHSSMGHHAGHIALAQGDFARARSFALRTLETKTTVEAAHIGARAIEALDGAEAARAFIGELESRLSDTERERLRERLAR